MSGNPGLTALAFSSQQLARLTQLDVLDLDPQSLASDCAAASVVALQSRYRVCVTDRGPSSASRHHAWSTKQVALCVGLSVALVVLLSVGGGSYYYRKCQQTPVYHDGKSPGQGQAASSSSNHPTVASLLHSNGDGDGRAPAYSELGRSSYASSGASHLLQSLSASMSASALRSAMRFVWDDDELFDWRVDYDAVERDEVIASGGFGDVWLASYRGQQVAVKTLKPSAFSRAALGDFIMEIKLLARLDHPRIVKLLGVAWTKQSDIMAITEYLTNQDLQSALATPLIGLERGVWDEAKRQVALDVVEALTYIHSLEPVLIHRDLKSRNVLLDDQLRAKLTDCGVARFYYADGGDANTAPMTCGVGTARWLAPEVLLGDATYDARVDVYAFGLLLSQLDTHCAPFVATTCEEEDDDGGDECDDDED